MRLCYVGNLKSVHTRRWLEYFVRQGHEVHLLTLYPDAPPLAGVQTHYAAALPPAWVRRVRRGQGLVSWLFSAWRIKRLVRALKPDVLHAHFVAFYGWLAALAGFHPLVITLWGGDILADQGALRFPGNWLTPFALRRADLVTVVSEHLLDAARPFLRSATGLRLVRIGADLEAFSPAGETESWKSRLELGSGPVVLSPRPFEPVYNIETIVAAVPYVLEKIPGAHFVFKDHPRSPQEGYRRQVRQMMDDLDRAGAIRYVSELPYSELPGLYRLADVVVSVALSDGFPVSVLEAMACGAPLVLGRSPYLNELGSDERHALVVSPDDPRALAEAIVRLLGDDRLRQEMSAANLDWVRAHGDFHAEMRKMTQLYESLA